MPEWYVFISDFNRKEIKKYNIFDHYSFREGCRKIARKRGITKEEFAEAIERELMYYYWSKCEWEIILEDWPPHETFRKEKIDVYDQVNLNMGVFIDYAWNHRKELAKKGED